MACGSSLVVVLFVVACTCPNVSFDAAVGGGCPRFLSQEQQQEKPSGRSQKTRRVSYILVPLSHPTAEDVQTMNGPFRLSSLEDGVLFDIDADGSLELVSWPTEGSHVAFLAIDRNTNGRIDDGAELFGAQTIPNAPDGFTALMRIEKDNENGALTTEDSVFARLLLWTDQNRNGRSDPGELAPVSGAFAKIGLGYFANDRVDRNGNNFVNRGWAVFGRDFNGKPNDPILPIFEVSPAIKRAPYR